MKELCINCKDYHCCDCYDCDVCDDYEEKKILKSVVPELDKTYVQHKGTWQEATFKIGFIGDGVALGVSYENRLYGPKGKKELFYAEGKYAGYKYFDETRANYRLQEIEG